MDKLLQKSKVKRKNQRTLKKSLIGGSIIATLIAASPYLFYLYQSVPEQKVWDTFLVTYTSTYFEDVNYVAWIFVSKAIPVLFLLIWFFTCRHWWYHVIIVPLAMYLYQIFGLFNDDYAYVDEYQLMYLLPIMAITVPSIYLIRAKMFSKLISIDQTMEELEEEFKFKPKGFLQKLGDYF